MYPQTTGVVLGTLAPEERHSTRATQKKTHEMKYNFNENIASKLPSRVVQATLYEAFGNLEAKNINNSVL